MLDGTARPASLATDRVRSQTVRSVASRQWTRVGSPAASDGRRAPAPHSHNALIVRSADAERADKINPAVVETTAEVGLALSPVTFYMALDQELWSPGRV